MKNTWGIEESTKWCTTNETVVRENGSRNLETKRVMKWKSSVSREGRRYTYYRIVWRRKQMDITFMEKVA
jgi:hypothetical protein